MNHLIPVIHSNHFVAEACADCSGGAATASRSPADLNQLKKKLTKAFSERMDALISSTEQLAGEWLVSREREREPQT